MRSLQHPNSLMRMLLVLLMAVGLVPLAFGQAGADTLQRPSTSGIARGMVWDMPIGVDRAVRDLTEMRSIGVEAVRTQVIRDPEVLARADTLGMSLYIDLPIERLPARRLRDSLEFARAVLDTVLGLAQIHSSLRHIGLARHLDVSDDATCAALEALADHARRQGPSGVRLYYLTRRTDSDRCAGAVDFVLLDVRDRDNPAEALRVRSTLGAVGIGALGVPVRADTARGLNVPFSPEAQARYLEEKLAVLLADTFSVAQQAVFVYRWRDVRHANPSTAHDLDAPYVDRYGLHTNQGVQRPAYDVVRGFYTGRQTTFAFSRGARSAGEAPWTTLFGWAVVTLLGTFYALSPRFRHMLPRYFAARFFYRDAVREGRDVLFGASTVLLIAISSAFGLTASVAVDVLRTTEPFVTAVRWLPQSTQEVIITLLAQPLVLVVLGACGYAVAIILWTAILSLLSKGRLAIAPGQALMLVIWPRWPLLIVMLAAMVIASIDGAPPKAVLVIMAAWVVISLLAVGRALIDFVLVTRVPPYLLIPALMLNPGIVVAVVLALILLPFQPEIRYLWSIATQL